MRQTTMIGFLQARNCTNLVSSWRHPESRPDSTSTDYYRTIGRVLEEGKFHDGFFDDRLAMPDRYGNDRRHTVQHGIRCVKMDPATALTVMGMVTERLGLGATYSTTYFEPFHVARSFATFDLMTGGRAAWNVVTSMNDGEALRYAAHRARPNRPFVGGPKEVADGMEQWFATGVCDGFVLAATHVPGTYMDFVKHVVPELQRRGLHHKDYKGATLRENLGLPIPKAAH